MSDRQHYQGMAVLAQAIDAFATGMALQPEQVFVHARRLREADETLIPRDPVGRNKGVHLLPPHILNLMISVAASDPIAHAPRLVRAWRAAAFVVPDAVVINRDIPQEHLTRMAGRTLAGDLEHVIDRYARDPRLLRRRLDQDFWVTLTVGEALDATVRRTHKLVDQYDARVAEELTERQLFRVPGREREIRIEPLRRTAQLASSHFEIAGELWADSMAHGAVWQPTGSPSGGSEQTAVP
jgi:hypothetical protein